MLYQCYSSDKLCLHIWYLTIHLLSEQLFYKNEKSTKYVMLSLTANDFNPFKCEVLITYENRFK